MKTTKTRAATKTIYRECDCGENAHDAQADKRDGQWVTYWACRNCRAEIHRVSK